MTTIEAHTHASIVGFKDKIIIMMLMMVGRWVEDNKLRRKIQFNADLTKNQSTMKKDDGKIDKRRERKTMAMLSLYWGKKLWISCRWILI